MPLQDSCSDCLQLLALLRLTNLTFVTYHQPVLYSTSKDEIGFHVTIGWSLEVRVVGFLFMAILTQLLGTRGRSQEAACSCRRD